MSNLSVSVAKVLRLAARELTGHQSAGGEQLHCASLVGLVFFSLTPPPFLLYSFSLLLLLLYFIITIVSIIFYFSY